MPCFSAARQVMFSACLFPSKIRDGWKNVPRCPQLISVLPTGEGSNMCAEFEPPDGDTPWGRRVLRDFYALLSQRVCCKKSQSCLDLSSLESCMFTSCLPCPGASNESQPSFVGWVGDTLPLGAVEWQQGCKAWVGRGSLTEA